MSSKRYLYLLFFSLFIISCEDKQVLIENKSNFKKLSFYEGYYDAFGTLIDDDYYLYYYTCRGTLHVGDSGSSIILMKIHKSFDKKIKLTEVYKDINKSIDVRNVAGGKIGDNHYIFLSKYSPNSDKKWVGFGYIKINQKKKIKEYIELGLDKYDVVNPHGHIIKIENDYYQTIYAQKDKVYDVLLLKSSDNGNHWEYSSIIYSGKTYFNESSGEYLGKGIVKVITRKDIKSGMVEFISLDYGKTWTSPQSINISTKGTNVPHTEKVDDKLYLCYTDRNSSSLKISYENKEGRYLLPKTLSYAEDNKTWFLGYSPIIYDHKYFYTLYADHQGDYKSTKTYFLKFNKKYLNFDK